MRPSVGIAVIVALLGVLGVALYFGALSCVSTDYQLEIGGVRLGGC